MAEEAQSISYRNTFAPVTAVYPITNRLLLSFAKDAGALFTLDGWKTDKVADVYSRDHIAWLENNHQPEKRKVLDAKSFNIMAPSGKYSVGFAIELGAGGRYQQQITDLRSTIRLNMSSRPNTSRRPNVINYLDPLPVPGATFVANYGGEYNRITYTMANVQGEITAIMPDTHVENPYVETAPGNLYASNAQLLALAGRMNDLLNLPPKEGILEAAAGEMTLTISQREKEFAIIDWPDAGKWKDCWLRLDAEAGELNVLADGKGWALPPQKALFQIGLSDCPPEGTTLHLYAISADGKEWHHRSFTIQPFQ